VNLVTIKPAKIKSLGLLAMLVEEHQIGVMVRNEIYLQTSVSISMSRVLDEPTDLRQLIQASARATLNLGRECSRRHSRWFRIVVLASLLSFLQTR